MNEIPTELQVLERTLLTIEKKLQKYAYAHLKRRAILKQWVAYQKHFQSLKQNLLRKDALPLLAFNLVNKLKGLNEGVVEVTSDDDFFILSDAVIAL
ncbi:hypothetical protein [Rossellomorea marisflavi]|uniref:hypothetical protein n=1 Tax=Rossellomorea marisflavi TaxID=189381 RepID=UPI003F9F3900